MEPEALIARDLKTKSDTCGFLARVFGSHPAEKSLRTLARIAAELGIACPNSLSVSELDQEYMALFGIPGPRHAAPCESVFRDHWILPAALKRGSNPGETGETIKGLLTEEPTLEARKFCLQAGLLPVEELPDLAYLCEREAEAQASEARPLAKLRRQFRQKHAVKWIGDLRKKVVERGRLGYYRAALELAEAVLQEKMDLVEPDCPLASPITRLSRCPWNGGGEEHTAAGRIRDSRIAVPKMPQSKNPASFRGLAASLILCIALSGAGSQAANKKSLPKEAQLAPKPSALIWPLPPDPPRIRWVAQYSDMAKVKRPVARKPGWLEKVTGTKTLDEKLELKKPYGVTTDKRGRIYVADTELKTVFMIDPGAKAVERREGDSRAPLAMPVGVAVDSDDRLFVSDAALHSVICFNPAGAPIARFGTTVLGRPGGIAIDRQRNRLYVVDAKDSRIAVFDTGSLKFVSYFGGPSKPGTRDNGTFLSPTNAAVDRQGNIYVADTGNYRVQILDPTGTFLRTFGAQGDAPGEFIRPKGIAVDSEGHVYVADAEFNNFQILTPEGQPLLAVGALGDDPGEFALVAGLHIDSEDRIYTTEMFRGRVQVFQYISQRGSAEGKAVNRSGN